MESEETPGVFNDKGINLKSWKSPHFHASLRVHFGDTDAPRDFGRAFLQAWDPVKQKQVWKLPVPPQWNAGTMTTRGNRVFESLPISRSMA